MTNGNGRIATTPPILWLPPTSLGAEPGGQTLGGASLEEPMSGGAVELFVEDLRIRFEINAQGATRSGLRINPRVLRLARLVAPDEK